MPHRYGLLAVLLLFVASPALAQQTDPDEIFLTSGESIEAVVTEVLLDAVKYRKWSNRTGPVYTTPKSEIHMILYANGERDLFREGAAAPRADTETSGSPAAATPAAATPAAAAPAATASSDEEREPRSFWQSKHNTSRHTSIGLIDTGGAYPFAFIMDETGNNIAVFHESPTSVVGVGPVVRIFYALNADEDFSTMSLFLGPNLMFEYQVAEQFSVFASYGVGFAMTGVQVQEEFNLDTDFDDALSAGAAFWFSENWGAHGKALIGNGDTTFTLGLSRRF